MSNRKLVKYLIVFFTVCLVVGSLVQVYETSKPQLDPSTKQYLLESVQGEIGIEESLQRSWQSNCDSGKQESCESISESKIKVENLKKKLKDIESQ